VERGVKYPIRLKFSLLRGEGSVKDGKLYIAVIQKGGGGVGTDIAGRKGDHIRVHLCAARRQGRDHKAWRGWSNAV